MPGESETRTLAGSWGDDLATKMAHNILVTCGLASGKIPSAEQAPFVVQEGGWTLGLDESQPYAEGPDTPHVIKTLEQNPP